MVSVSSTFGCGQSWKAVGRVYDKVKLELHRRGRRGNKLFERRWVLVGCVEEG